MNITRQDREALSDLLGCFDELLGCFDDCQYLTEEHVNAMLVILAEHRQKAVAALEKERDGLREATLRFARECELVNCHANHQHLCDLNKALAALSQKEGGS